MKSRSWRQGIRIEIEVIEEEDDRIDRTCISPLTRGHLDVISIEFSVVSGSNQDLIIACIESLYQSVPPTRHRWSVTATCNAPGTGLGQRLVQRFPGIRVISNVAPRGFAANHNTVLRESTADYVWILNDDLVFHADTVRRVTEFMEAPENSRVAVVSPRLLNTDGSLQPSTYSFPSMPQTLLAHSGIREHHVVDRLVGAAAPFLRPRTGSSRYWSHDRTVEVDTLRGACVAVRMKAVREVGPMAEVALVGAEEIEWHRRFKDAGWKIVFLADATVTHHGSQSVAFTTQHSPEYLKGVLYYFRAGASPISYWLLCTMLLSMFGTQLVIARMRRDASGVQVTRRSIRVVWDALRGEPQATRGSA
jgi:GT2 family glycosyltransferase